MGFLKALFGFGKRKGRKKSRKATRVTGSGFVPSDVGGSAATILLAEIDGAGGDKVTERLAEIFSGISDVSVFRRKTSIKSYIAQK